MGVRRVPPAMGAFHTRQSNVRRHRRLGETIGTKVPVQESSRWLSDTFLGAGEDGCDRTPKFVLKNH
jgi:hypothetical protein